MTAATKTGGKNIKFKAQLLNEYKFLKNIFELSSIPLQKDDNENDADYEMVTDNVKQEDKVLQNRARSIAELEQKLEQIKSQNQFNLKDKLAKKSLTSKINKKLKKVERQANKTRVKQPKDIQTQLKQDIKKEKLEKPLAPAKPVFNTDGKLVFSKFDFAKTDNFDKSVKGEKDPKKILNSIKQQEEKFKKLEESDNKEKVKEIKEKLAWKTTLQKAEGQKIKDDPILLKKSIKKMDQKKKHSKKQWDNRIQSVAQKKEERQKKRKENISKKKKEKKSKIVKTAAKRGRVVI